MKVESTDDVIRIEVDLPVPLERAWALLTEAPHIAQWWGDHANLQARLGGKLREVWSNGSREVVTSGVVTRCDPPFALEMTWADEDWPGETTVVFNLSEASNGTHLVLIHSGWRVQAAGNRTELIDGHARGWSEHLVRLVAYAAKEKQSDRSV